LHIPVKRAWLSKLSDAAAVPAMALAFALSLSLQDPTRREGFDAAGQRTATFDLTGADHWLAKHDLGGYRAKERLTYRRPGWGVAFP